jgi:Zn-dependent M28 family amino/carboxypeptidase
VVELSQRISKRSVHSLFFSFGILLAAGSAAADPATAIRLRDAALNDPTAWQLLQSLTDMGPRPVGSPAAAQARDWGVAQLKALGFSNVHIEPFAKAAWVRDAEAAELLTPVPQKLALLGLGHSAPTPPGGLTAEVAVVGSMAELIAAPMNAFKGKIVLVNQPMTRTQDESGYVAAVKARNGWMEAAKRGAIAYLTRSISTNTARAPHTGTTLSATDLPQIPAAALGVPDAELLADLAAKGPVRIHLLLQSHILANGQAWTVSGDITGSEKPDQVIVIGGHMDSWDPGTGAIDDGAGVAITTAAAHLIGALPVHPRRTIRVVFWGSEEQGGSGAAYLAAHQGTLDKIAIASESDLGADEIYSLQLPAGGWKTIGPLESILAPLKVIASAVPAKGAGSDVSEIEGAGVPVFALNQDASHYFDYHHSADDTLAIVDPKKLAQNVAAWAAVLDMLADSDVDFRRAP